MKNMQRMAPNARRSSMGFHTQKQAKASKLIDISYEDYTVKMSKANIAPDLSETYI